MHKTIAFTMQIILSRRFGEFGERTAFGLCKRECNLAYDGVLLMRFSASHYSTSQVNILVHFSVHYADVTIL